MGLANMAADRSVRNTDKTCFSGIFIEGRAEASLLAICDPQSPCWGGWGLENIAKDRCGGAG